MAFYTDKRIFVMKIYIQIMFESVTLFTMTKIIFDMNSSLVNYHFCDKIINDIPHN